MASHCRSPPGLRYLQCGTNYKIPGPQRLTVDDIVTSTTDPPPPAEQPAALLSGLCMSQDLSDVTCSSGLDSLACRLHFTLTSSSPPQTRRPADLCRNPLLKLIGAGVPVSKVPVAHQPGPSVAGLAASTPRTPQSAATRIKRSHLTSPTSTLQRPTASLCPRSCRPAEPPPSAPLGRLQPLPLPLPHETDAMIIVIAKQISQGASRQPRPRHEIVSRQRAGAFAPMRVSPRTEPEFQSPGKPGQLSFSPPRPGISWTWLAWPGRWCHLANELPLPLIQVAV